MISRELDFTALPQGLAHLKLQFKTQHHLHFPKFLSPQLLKTLKKRIEKQSFSQYEMEVGSEETADGGELAQDLGFIFWQEDFVNFLSKVTGKGPFSGIATRIYRLKPNGTHHFPWHTDVDENNRVLGLSLNLSSGIYEGGVFEIREYKKYSRTYRRANTGPGDLLLFDISPRFMHRVTPVTGRAPKTSFVAWFLGEPK